ncbi:undecaprenyl/decaprenyl-phosphate alpha-N-acetylglucosaminyl 1-phosphate transferase [Patescibacteria group bacterium]|nr:undecaprenyl/decaprenyl-phosphate alpha-N-acetylglucosaminyl 1-phosphate transferase [Patescibacteria group bacterium]
MKSIETLTLSAFLISLTLSLMIIPLTIWVFKKMDWVVDPKKNKHPAHVHKVPVPKGGGIAVFIAVVVAVLCLIQPDKHIIAILLAMFVTLVVGVWDDIKGSSPYWRIILNILPAVIIVASGIGIAYISNPLGGIIDLSWPRYSFTLLGKMREIWLFPDLIALLWIPFLMNAINWSSGVDGQVSGVVAVAAITVGLISLNYSADIAQWPVVILAFALAGAFVGLAFFSFFPQKIMPGYSATSLAGLLLGVLSILSTAKIGTLIVVLGVPTIDAVYVIGRRLLSGKSPVWGDRGHLHHRLMKMGWGKRRIAIFYWLTALALGTVALQVDARKKFIIMLGLGGLMIVFMLWRYLLLYSKQPGRVSG